MGGLDFGLPLQLSSAAARWLNEDREDASSQDLNQSRQRQMVPKSRKVDSRSELVLLVGFVSSRQENHPPKSS